MPKAPARDRPSPARARGADVRDRIRGRLQHWILGGTYRPGDKLVQQRLARRLGVSQSVVREALLELQLSGLVETCYNRGMFVSPLDAGKLLDAFDVREVHEGLAVRLCCERAARADLRELEGLAERICALAAAGRRTAAAALDREFHQRLIRLSGNTMLARLSQSFWVLGKTVRVGRPPRTVRAEHRAILRAIEANRPEEAERAVREHIRLGRQVVEERLRNRRFVPAWVT